MGARLLNLVVPEGNTVATPVYILYIDETYTQIRIKFKGYVTRLGTYVKKCVWGIVNKLAGILHFLYDNDEIDSRGIRSIHSFFCSFLGIVQ